MMSSGFDLPYDWSWNSHFAMGVDQNGDGPVADEWAHNFVCFSCPEPWPCKIFRETGEVTGYGVGTLEEPGGT